MINAGLQRLVQFFGSSDDTKHAQNAVQLEHESWVTNEPAWREQKKDLLSR